ncbi:MAG: hypothetical protein ACYC0V_16265 [Armatimonadota bacterium]
MKAKNSVLTGCMMVALMVTLLCSLNAQALSLQGDPGLNAFQLGLAGASDPGPGISSSSTGLKERGVTASDIIKGNGTKAGYMLGHGGIVDVSETVSVGGSMKRRSKDYFLDYNTGTILFTEPVRTSDVIKVNYRYVPGKEGQRNGIGIPALSLRLGSRSTLGILYASNAAIAGQGYDVMTYGLNLKTKIGKKSSMSNMLYMSTPQDSGRMSLVSGLAAQGAKPKADNMFIHDSTLQSGSMSIKLNYQDVGKDFSGFTALRQQGAAPGDILNQLEKEKGLKRMGMQADVNMGGKTTTGLGFNRISDTGGDIVKQSFKIGNDKLKFNADMQKIDKGFTRFNDLAEGERGQWAKEQGMSRSNIQLSMAPGKGMAANSAWNALNINTISDQSGQLTTRNLNFSTKKFSMTSSQMKIDAGFKRLASLSDAERTNMALSIYQQFDPNATAANVNDQDRAQILGEAGIERKNTRMNLSMGTGSAMQLGMLNINDKSGGISRQTLSLSGKGFSISGFTQSIDSGFTRLNALANVEKANFGNETGMKRTNLAGSFTINPKLQLSTSMSKVASDNGGLSKYGINLTSAKFTMSANYMNMDNEFTRVMDLADPDKGKLATEQGMKRYDLTTHLQATKNITIDSYMYNAKNANTEMFRRQLLNSLVYSPVKGPRITMLMDQFSTGIPTAINAYSHQKYTFDYVMGKGKITLNALHDTLTNENPSTIETIETSMLHFNTDMQKRTTISGDLKSIKNTNGKFEETQTLRLNTKINARLAFIGTRSTIQTQEMNVATQEYSVTGKVTKQVNIAAKFGDTLVNGLTATKVRELSLNPDAPKDMGAFKQVNWKFGYGQVENGGKVQTERQLIKIDTNILKHQLGVEYASGITKEGNSSIIRTVNLSSNPNPKLKVNYNLAYKMRDTGAAQNILVRNYNADWQITPFTKLIYYYSSNKEKPDGTIDPVDAESFKLATALSKTLGLQGQWEHSGNASTKYDRNTLSLGIAGRLTAKGTVEAGYGFDNVLTNGIRAESRTYKIKYDQQVDSDHFLSLSGTFTDWQGARPASVKTDDVTYQIDFKTVFD